MISQDFHTSNSGIKYKFCLPSSKQNSLVFIFGYIGAGYHYELCFDFYKQLILLYLIRDGIRVYLQHLCIKLPEKINIELYWKSSSIRVFINKWCIINVFDDEIKEGHWGFKKLSPEAIIPSVEISQLSEQETFRVLCMGDGFSNARWPNRHFLSWPELTFGDSTDYLNYCVSSGNSRRMITLVDKILQENLVKTLDKIILGVGTDDFIEGENLSDFLCRLQQIVTSLFSTTNSIYILSLPPRIASQSSIHQWNEQIKDKAQEINISYIDIHSRLSENPERYLTMGDYPNVFGQEIIAQTVADNIGISLPKCQFDHSYYPDSSTLPPFLQKSVSKLRSACNYGLGLVK